jgi:dTDP-4-dehydrorhamnose reductase
VKRLLITGGSGYLGRHLVPRAARAWELRYTYYQRPPGAPGGHKLDVRDREAVLALVRAAPPDAIIHLAGSNRTPDMQRVIELGARHVVAAAAETGARLIHLSSDVIFDGRRAPYRESDPPSPLHDYGRAKAAAEAIVAGYPDHAIVRTSLIYGLELMDHSTGWIAAALAAGRPVTLFRNQYRNPIWVDSLCQAILELAESDFRGVIHVAGRQALNRAEFGLRLLDWWKVTARTGLAVGDSDDSWPLDCRLDLSLAERLLATPLPGMDAVLPAAG